MKTRIVKKVSIPETFRMIIPGESANFNCQQVGMYSSACVAVCRLNKRAGFIEYEIETADNGNNYTVTRNRRG